MRGEAGEKGQKSVGCDGGQETRTRHQRLEGTTHAAQTYASVAYAHDRPRDSGEDKPVVQQGFLHYRESEEVNDQ